MIQDGVTHADRKSSCPLFKGSPIVLVDCKAP
jgi:superfamily I DNA and/or RNA helicase